MGIRGNINQIKKSISTKGSFGQNFVITTFGAGSAYVIGFVFTPVLSRIYTPEAYGIFAVFNAWVINISLIVTLGYEQAIIIPKHRVEFYSLIRISLFFLTILCALLLFITFFINDGLLRYFDLLDVKKVLWLLPLLVFFNVSSQVLTTIGVRLKNYKTTSVARLAAVLGSKGYALSYGLVIGSGAIGFISGEILGKLSHNISLLMNRKLFKSIQIALRTSSVQVDRLTAKNYKSYPVYTLPSVWLYTLSTQLPIYVLAKLYNADDVGYFSMASALLSIPLTLVGRSMGTVFLQRASELYNEGDFGKINYIIWEIIKKILIIGSFPILLIIFFGIPIFEFALGEEWGASGIYARYMGIYFLFELIAIPVSMLYRVMRLEKKFFIQSLLSFSIILVFLGIGTTFEQAEWLIFFLMIGKLVENSIKIGRVLILLRNKLKNKV